MRGTPCTLYSLIFVLTMQGPYRRKIENFLGVNSPPSNYTEEEGQMYMILLKPPNLLRLCLTGCPIRNMTVGE